MSTRAAVGLAVGMGMLMSVAAVPAAVPGYGQVAAVFKQHCVICHSGNGAPLGLRLDSYANIRQGSDRGAVVVPGDAGGSELVRRIRGQSLPRMPLTGPPYLDPVAEALMLAWVQAGAPRGELAGNLTEKVAEKVTAVDPTAKAAGAALNPDPRAVDAGIVATPTSGYLTFAQVAPIFLKRCVKCHKDNGLRGSPPEGLRLGSWQQVVGGGERVVVLPGYPQASELVRKIEGRSRPRMPFDGPPFLAPEEIQLIRQWVAQGARDSQGSRAPISVGRRLRLEGRLTALWQLDDLPLQVTGGTRVKKNPRPGDQVRVRGVVMEDGSIRVDRIQRR
ncbi:MAG: c-type cytochrome domain-containing protein [Motiliproteus sp.]